MLKGLCVFTPNIEKAVSAGYDYIILPGIEISKLTDDEFEDVSRRVKDAGIKVMGYNAYCNASLPIVGDGFDEDKTREYAALMCKRGKVLGIRNIGIGAPFARQLPEGYDMNKAYSQGKRFIEITAEIAAEYGFNVLVEGLHKYYCDFVQTLGQAYDLMADINMPNVKMIVDFYHMKLNLEDYKSAVKYLPYSLDVHISGCDENRDRPYIDSSYEEEIKEIAQILKKANYDISVSLEPDNTDENFDQKAKTALELMKKYL